MSSDPRSTPHDQPTEVLIHQRSRRLELRWPSGYGVSLGHARLRQACKCAWCEGPRRRSGEGTNSPPTNATAEAEVTITRVTPIGDVGLQLHFSDGHDRGIYPWSYLHTLAT